MERNSIKKHKKITGLTLIEVLLYVSISSFVITGIIMSLYMFKNQTDQTFKKTASLLRCVSEMFSFDLNPSYYATSSGVSSSSLITDDILFQKMGGQFYMICNLDVSTQILHGIST